MKFLDMLNHHKDLSRRRKKSVSELHRVRDAFSKCTYFKDLKLTVYCAGSLARMEIGQKSDLDVFVTAEDQDSLKSRLAEYEIFAQLIHLNKELGFPPFSNDGEYLKVYFIDDLKDRTGSRRDDHENYFTARMLLMLESSPLIHDEIYDSHLNGILKHYYRDKQSKRTFKPLFLLNDILRYWRTLCLNYEERRHDPGRPWRKKNVNLKFSRMMTVFGTVLPLIVEKNDDASSIESLCRKTSLERFALGLDWLEDDRLLEEWPEILDNYESFLSWKDDDDVEKYLKEGAQKETVRDYAERLSNFFYRALTHEKITLEFRRYLIL